MFRVSIGFRSRSGFTDDWWSCPVSFATREEARTHALLMFNKWPGAQGWAVEPMGAAPQSTLTLTQAPSAAPLVSRNLKPGAAARQSTQALPKGRQRSTAKMADFKIVNPQPPHRSPTAREALRQQDPLTLALFDAWRALWVATAVLGGWSALMAL